MTQVPIIDTHQLTDRLVFGFSVVMIDSVPSELAYAVLTLGPENC